MPKIDKDILYSTLFGEAVPVPQFTRESDGKQIEHRGEKAPYIQIVDENGYPVSADKPLQVQLAGSYVRKSTDPLPQGKEGDTLYLWDTQNAFIHDGAEWRVL
jgi:hypothetical protein